MAWRIPTSLPGRRTTTWPTSPASRRSCCRAASRRKGCRSACSSPASAGATRACWASPRRSRSCCRPVRCRPTTKTEASLGLHAGGFEDRLPSAEFGLLEGGEGSGLHLLDRGQVLAEFLHALAHGRVGQGGDC